MVLHSVFDRHMYKVYGESKRDWQNIKNGNHAFNVGCGTLYYKHFELLFTMLSQTVSLYMSRRMIDILCLIVMYRTKNTLPILFLCVQSIEL